MCFDLSWNTGFSVSFMQLWLSQCITVGSSSVLNRSESGFRSHTASLLAALAAVYSAFAVLWAIGLCFLLDQEIIAEPRLKQYPEVLFRSTTLPIQSESVKPCNITPHWMCIWGYGPLNIFQDMFHCHDVWVKYIKDPIRSLYMVGIIRSWVWVNQLH